MAAKFVIALAVVGCVSGLQQKREDNQNPLDYQQYQQYLSNLNQFGEFKPPANFPGTQLPGGGSFPNPQLPGGGSFPTLNPGSTPAKRQTIPTEFKPDQFTNYNKWIESLGGNYPTGVPNPAETFGFGGQSGVSESSGSAPAKRQTIPTEFKPDQFTNYNKWIESLGGSYPTGVPNPAETFGGFGGQSGASGANPTTGSS